jgi:hypothetical protein
MRFRKQPCLDGLDGERGFHPLDRHLEQTPMATRSNSLDGDLLERAANLQQRRKPITKWRSAFRGLMSIAALLMPLMAAANSYLQSKATDGKVVATAHVDFKIVIPTAVYLHLGSGNDRDGSPVPVRIMSNSRTVTLNVSVRTPNDGGSDSSTRTSMNSPIAGPISAVPAKALVSGDKADRNVTFNAAAGKIITQDEECALRDAHAAAASANPHRVVNVNATEVFCTVSMP